MRPYGYAFDFSKADVARVAAERKCIGRDCKVVMMLKRSCAAFAIDGHTPCRPHRYASARRLGEAENVALKSCYQYGGTDCVICAFACLTWRLPLPGSSPSYSIRAGSLIRPAVRARSQSGLFCQNAPARGASALRV